MKTKLYKICYEQSQLSSLGAGFDLWDNLSNDQPQLREYPIFECAYNSNLTKNLDYFGLVSPKFEKKSNITGGQFLDWVKASQQTNLCDVYFINPVPIVEAIFPGTIQHGENCHPGLLSLLQRNITEASKIDLGSLYMDCNTFSLCNFFVGNHKFWGKYIKFVNNFLESVNNNPKDIEMLYQKSANYGPNKVLPYYTFAVERLFSIFLSLERGRKDGITATHYAYTRAELITKTTLPEPIIDELRCLSDIKQIAVSAGYPNMMQHWAFLRNKLAQQNQYLFLME
jgi:hypothetical protein